jgi:3-deoxy-D-manno-octulosonic-acid transferase
VAARPQGAGYRQHWGERLGFLSGATATPRWRCAPVLWVHAVSVGETRAAEPLVDALLAEYPHSRIILTHMTPTGRATGKALFARHGERLVQSYLPYDTGSMVSRFIRHFRRVCILMETEVWPNLIAVCNARKVPVVLANARLSERSLRKATRLGSLLLTRRAASRWSPRRPRPMPSACVRWACSAWKSPAASSSMWWCRKPRWRSVRAARRHRPASGAAVRLHAKAKKS